MSKRSEAVKTVRDMGDDELYDHVRAQRRKLFEMRFQQATGQVENHRQLREIRRDIARALTVERQNAKGLTPVIGAAKQTGPAASGSPSDEAPRRSPRRMPSLRRHPSASQQESTDAESVGDATPEEEDVSLSEAEPGAEVVTEPAEEAAEAEDEPDEESDVDE